MECAICLEEGNLISFNHENKCGNILVHDSCLTNWFLKNNNECIICRSNLIKDYELLSSEDEVMEIEINRNNNENLKNIFIFLFLCIIFLLLIYLLITFL